MLSLYENPSMVVVPYILVQLIAYAFEMSCFAITLSFLGLEIIGANLVSKLFAGSFAFFAHRKFTFSGAENSNGVFQAIKYFALLSLNIPISSILISLFVWINLNPIIAKLLSDSICIVATFIVSKKIIFTSTSLSK